MGTLFDRLQNKFMNFKLGHYRPEPPLYFQEIFPDKERQCRWWAETNRVVLKPLNREYSDIILENMNETDFVIAGNL